MKKVIRITESRLRELIKKVISEAPDTYRTSNLANPEDFLPGAKPAPAAAPAAPVFNPPRPTINYPDIPQPKSVPAPPAPPPPKTIFGIGDRDPKIKIFQNDLVALGYNVGKKGPDGIFGPATEAAVRDFQSKNNLKVSGRVGPPTMKMLKSAIAIRKANTDPNAEWNKDRREDGNAPVASTAAATPPTVPSGPAPVKQGGSGILTQYLRNKEPRQRKPKEPKPEGWDQYSRMAALSNKLHGKK